MVYPFAVSSVIEVPWANAMGSMAGLLPFSRTCLGAASAILTAVAAFALVRSSKHTALWFGGYLVLFYGVGFVSSSAELGRWTASGLASVSPIMSWLAANHVHSGDRLLTAGRHAYFEDPALRTAPVDNMFLDWTWRNGLGEDVEWQIETIGRFDVRMIPKPKAIPMDARPNDFVLTVARLDALGVPSSHDFLLLYRVARISAQAPAPKYLIRIPAARFQTGQAVDGAGAKTTSSLSYVPPLGFAAGTYQVRFDAAESTNDPLTVEVTGAQEKVLIRKTGGAAETPASFSHFTGPVAFHILGDIANISGFEGLDIEWLSNSPPPTEPPNGFISDGVFTDSEPSDLLHARSHNGSACYIDVINSAAPARLLSVDRQGGARILGWAANTDDRVVAEQVYIKLSSTAGVHYWAKAHQYVRPDVAKAFGNPALSNSGFTVSADLRSMTPGVYGVKIVLLNGGYARECDSNRELNVQ
jgi:hypothetical protein